MNGSMPNQRKHLAAQLVQGGHYEEFYKTEMTYDSETDS